MSESFQHKLSRVRPPRVQITYDVETGGAIQMKEIPFVVGIMSDLTGLPYEAREGELGGAKGDEYTFHNDDGTSKTVTSPSKTKSIPQRKFVAIDRDNFEEVMATVLPMVKVSVPNEFAKADDKGVKPSLVVKLAFSNLDHFSPLSIVRNVPEISAQFAQRTALSNLKAKMDGNLAVMDVSIDPALLAADQKGKLEEGLKEGFNDAVRTASKKQFGYVLFLSEKEKETGLYTLKNMRTGEQAQLSFDQLKKELL